MKSLFLSLLVLLQVHLPAQTATHTEVSKLVLENLGPNVNSSASEIHPVISADGKILYFVRDGHNDNFANQDVWYCERSGNGWTQAIHPKEPLNYHGKSSGISNVSIDGNQLLVRGAFEDGEFVGGGLSVIVKSKKGEWKDPKKLEIVNFTKYSNMGNTNNSFLSPDGKTLLFAFSDNSNGKKHELYVSFLTLKDKWSKPKSIKDFTKFVGKALNNNTWSEPVMIKSLSHKEYD